MFTDKIITEPEELSSVASHIINFEGLCAYDTETTGLYPHGHIIGYSLTLDLPELPSIYVVLEEWCTQSNKLLETNVKAMALDFVTRAFTNKKVIMHNATFDVNMTIKDIGYDLTPFLHSDTALMRHTINPECTTKFRLKELGDLYWPGASEEQKELENQVKERGGKWIKKQKDMFMGSKEILGKYAIQDTKLTLKLYKKQEPELDKYNLRDLFYNDEVMPLLKYVTMPMNRSGKMLDFDAMSNLEKDLAVNITKLETEIYNELEGIVPPFDDKLNIDSNQHLSWLLYNHFNELPKKLTGAGNTLSEKLIGKKPYNPTDYRAFLQACKNQDIPFRKYCSTDAETLGKYEHLGWVNKLLTLKKEKKLLSTYIPGFKNNAYNGFIYPSFNQAGTKTGRYSSSKPNFQNLPRSDVRIKSCIKAPNNKILIASDFSQLEPRVLAHVTGDPIMIEAFKSGLDFYSEVGIGALNLDSSKYSSNPKDDHYTKKSKEGTKIRDLSKVIALSTAYNTSPFKMYTEMKKNKIESSLEETRQIINNYITKFNIKPYMNLAKQWAYKKGVVFNMFGRRRPLPNAKRLFLLGKTEKFYPFKQEMNKACNYPIQSTAGGIMNRCGISIAKDFAANPHLGASIIMQVHDEYIIECDEAHKEEVMSKVKYHMENTVKLKVPLEAEPISGYNLAECK